MFAAAGAVGLYFLDPAQGHRRRAMLIQRTGGMVRKKKRRLMKEARHKASEAAGAAQRAAHPMSSQAPVEDDTTLARKVETILFRSPEVPKGSINVNSEKGVVVLRGAVDSTERIQELEQKAEAIPGVRGVRSMLHLAQ